MQALSWYVARLLAMSPEEISWRLRTEARHRLDRVIGPLRRQPRPLAMFVQPGSEQTPPPFRVCDVPIGAWARDDATPVEQQWCDRLTVRADQIAAGRLSFFDRENTALGNPIDWNHDHKHDVAAPLRFAPSIDYRDFHVTGDCKFVWEPNRHHQLVVLGRAYRATGQERYAAAAVAQVDSWLEQCPLGLGMNWRSPLELAIRLINWVWTYDLIHDSDALDAAARSRWLRSIYWHVWEIARNYSRGSSAGNHRIGEAAGVYVATSYFPGLKHAQSRRREALRILSEEILRQTHLDGGPREQALGYHMFILQFFLVSGLVARWTEDVLPHSYWSRLRHMFRFVGALQAGGANVPLFGDCDDGYVLDLGDGPSGARDLLPIGAALFTKDEIHVPADADGQAAVWLKLRDTNEDASTAARLVPLRSEHFERTGYYLLQSAAGTPEDRISVVFDCGPLGLKPMAGHGHADALSFTLRAFGEDVLVDPGTYDYFSHPQWRKFFRSTAAHNTIVVDGQDQSEMRGSFLWGRRAEACCLAWEPTDEGGAVIGEHDGYTRLARPVVHRRSLTLVGSVGEVLVRDELIGDGTHEAEVVFQFSEHCRVTRQADNVYEARVGNIIVTIELDSRLTVTDITGGDLPSGGWVSRGYHHKAPATRLTGCLTFDASVCLNSRIIVERAQ